MGSVPRLPWSPAAAERARLVLVTVGSTDGVDSKVRKVRFKLVSPGLAVIGLSCVGLCRPAQEGPGGLDSIDPEGERE